MTRPSPSPPSWWRPDVLAARRPALEARGRIKSALRRRFEAHGFVEVETPVLQVSPGNETHISAFPTYCISPSGEGGALFLRSSPEFACKKLLAAGIERLFTFAPSFRNRERGRLHHPEFTMLEWYRAGGALDDLIADAAHVFREAGKAVGAGIFRHRGATCAADAEPEIVTVVEAFRRHVGVDLDTLLPEQPGGLARLCDVAGNLGVRIADDDVWSDLFSKILVAWIEPNLGLGRPTVLTRYPASEAALAKLCPDDPRFALRFELYCCGIEVANAFCELTDVDEQRRRFEAAEAERRRIYGPTYPIDEELLVALAVMPEAAGIALGFDRLVMLATGAETIEDVLWAPVP